RVLDGACAVFDGKEGVEAQSETVWRQADRYKVPRLCFVNKMDKIGASFEFSFSTIKSRLGANGIPIQCPIGLGHEHKGLVDLMTMRACFFEGEKGEKVIEKDVPADMLDDVKKWRHIMVEKISELDDSLAEKYLTDENSITVPELKKA